MYIRNRRGIEAGMGTNAGFNVAIKFAQDKALIIYYCSLLII